MGFQDMTAQDKIPWYGWNMGAQRRDRVTRSVNYFARLAPPKKKKERNVYEMKLKIPLP